MNESSVGLKKIEIAVPTVTGLPTVWTEIMAAKIGSATFAESAPSKTDIKIEQKPKLVYRRVTTEEGVTTFVVSIYDVSPATLAVLKGGVVTGDGTTTPKTWGKPAEVVDLQKAVKLTTFDDYLITVPLADLQALINWPLTVGDLGSVDLTFTVLSPLDATLLAFSVSAPLEA
jgi:hypothetical protein